MAIVLLDSQTINKIAAGEVIDRPVSVVKELIENSLDAGATRVQVDIESGGKKRIRISDNGCGIDKADLPLAPVRHATSKLTDITDIYALASFGFRGEALASICHVASLLIQSRYREGDMGYQIRAENGDITPVEPCSLNEGTVIEVRDLFGNLPVRQKFLKSNATETAYIYDCVLQFALMLPNLDFVLVSDGKEMLNSTGISSQRQLAVHLLGRDVHGHLVDVDMEVGPIHFQGLISDPTLTYANRSKQFFSVNRRLIKSPIIQTAIRQSFKDISVKNRFPLVILNLQIEQSEVDVNVHPQKQDVKFLHPGFIFDALPKAIQLSLQMHQTGGQTQGSAAPVQAAAFSESNASVQRVSHGGSGSNDFWGQHSGSAVSAAISSGSGRAYGGDISTGMSSSRMAPTHGDSLHFKAFQPHTPTADRLFSSANLDELSQDRLEILQIFDTYLVVKTSSALWLFDQHAVHERILYERIKTDFNTGMSAASQPLLVSETVTLSPDLMAVYEDHAALISQLNFEVDCFGVDQLVVRSVPVVFMGVNAAVLIEDMLQQFKEVPGSSGELTLTQKEKLQMKACKAAIKAGKKLGLDEAKRLISDFLKSPANFTCPHGRPLFVKFSKSDLEKLFMRG